MRGYNTDNYDTGWALRGAEDSPSHLLYVLSVIEFFSAFLCYSNLIRPSKLLFY